MIKGKHGTMVQAGGFTLPQAVAVTLYGPKQVFLYEGETPQQQNDALKRMVERSGMLEVLFALETLKMKGAASVEKLQQVQQYVSELIEFSPFRQQTFEEFKTTVQGYPAGTHIPIGWLAGFLGITKDELHGELLAGRLKATGTPTPDGKSYAGIGVGGPHLVAWLDNIAFDPSGVKFKALNAFKSEDTAAN